MDVGEEAEQNCELFEARADFQINTKIVSPTACLTQTQQRVPESNTCDCRVTCIIAVAKGLVEIRKFNFDATYDGYIPILAV